MIIRIARKLRKEVILWKLRKKSRANYLYASPVGEYGKPYLQKIIEKFGNDHFDYIIFAYDDVDLSEEIFAKCTVIREKGSRWRFMKKYITPEVCSGYQYIFIWPDDIDIEQFSFKNFLAVMERNNLEVAQPALTPHSKGSHAITFVDETEEFGRLVDFVEIMLPVFREDSWEKFYRIIEPGKNPWGWGMDQLARNLCGYQHMGIIDCEAVTHTKDVSSQHRAVAGWRWFKRKHHSVKMARKMKLGSLK